MLERLIVIFFVLVASIVRMIAEGQGGDCPPLLETDLGDSESFNTTGLISISLAINATAQPEVQLLNHTIVCVAQGTRKDTWRMVSGVARYLVAPEELPLTLQFHFQCESDGSGWNTTIINSTEYVISTSPAANLSTELRTDCALCVSPEQLPEVNNEQHCVPCDSECNGFGQMRCTSLASSDCCAYFSPQGLCINGSCPGNSISNDTTFECVCPPNYTGAECDEDVDECETNPCINGANCTNSFGGFVCECPIEFTGSLCDVNVTDPCEQNPCMNGGSCTNIAGESFMCLCTAGYTGAMCENDTDNCGPRNPCMNGATCIDGVNEFTCNCTAGWSGDTCDVCTLERCANCTANVNQSYTAMCSQCEEGYQLENGVCVPECLVDGCINCSQLPSICIQCESGLTIAQGGSVCSPTTVPVPATSMPPSTTESTMQPTSTNSSQVNVRRLTGIVVGSVVGCLVLILLAVLVGAIVYRRRKLRVTVTFDMNTIKATHVMMNPVFDDTRREDSGIENDDEIMVNRGALEFDDD